ncbi:hypothetical protein Tco_0307700 [Tanacetum coccineum]
MMFTFHELLSRGQICYVSHIESGDVYCGSGSISKDINEDRRCSVPPNFPARFHPSDVLKFGRNKKLASRKSTPRITPLGSPPRLLASGFLKKVSKAGSPRTHSISFGPPRGRIRVDVSDKDRGKAEVKDGCRLCGASVSARGFVVEMRDRYARECSAIRIAICDSAPYKPRHAKVTAAKETEIKPNIHPLNLDAFHGLGSCDHNHEQGLGHIQLARSLRALLLHVHTKEESLLHYATTFLVANLRKLAAFFLLLVILASCCDFLLLYCFPKTQFLLSFYCVFLLPFLVHSLAIFLVALSCYLAAFFHFSSCYFPAFKHSLLLGSYAHPL